MYPKGPEVSIVPPYRGTPYHVRFYCQFSKIFINIHQLVNIPNETVCLIDLKSVFDSLIFSLDITGSFDTVR